MEHDGTADGPAGVLAMADGKRVRFSCAPHGVRAEFEDGKVQAFEDLHSLALRARCERAMVLLGHASLSLSHTHTGTL